VRKLRSWIMRFGGLFNKGRKDRELQDELETHIQMHVEDNLRSGMTPEEARRQALIQMGGIDSTKEACREQRGLPVLETVFQDLRYGMRLLRKNPGFATTAILTVAIGIGSCTVLFSMVNGVLLRPLRFRDPEQIVAISETKPNRQILLVTPAAYLDWVKQASVFAHLAALDVHSYATRLDGRAANVVGMEVTANYFSVLGIQPFRGRGFLADEGLPGKNHVVVLSYRSWQNQFGGRDDIIHQSIMLGDQPYTIVGVVPDIKLWGASALFTPLTFSAVNRGDYGSHGLTCIGRLKPGITLRQAQAEMDVVSDHIARAHPDSNLGHGARVASLLDYMTGDVRLQLLVLLCAVGFLLLIACVNVASLLVARANSRQREIAVRSALGASRGRIMRQFLSESLMLAVGGGALGVLLAYASMGAVSHFASRYLPRTQEISLDGTVLGMTVALMLVVGLGVGLVPVFQCSRADLAEPLKDSGRGTSSGRKPQRLRSLLVTAEIALAMMLLVGTGLLARSLMAMRQADQGFKTSDIYISGLSLAGKKYDSPQKIMAFVNDVIERVTALPDVHEIAFADDMPMVSGRGLLFSVADASEVPVRDLPVTASTFVTPDYFHAMSIPLVRGRGFMPQDTADAPRVVIINQELARRYFPGINPIGRRLMIYTMADKPDVVREIVGVVGNVRPWGPQSEIASQVYEPLAQHPHGDVALMLKAQGAAPALPAAVNDIVLSLDPDLPVLSLTRYDATVATAWFRQRFSMILFMLFSGIALVLAAVGIYGVMAYSVTQRTQEIGIRMALGAQVGDVLRLVFAGGAKIVTVGVLMGAAGSLAFARVLQSLLFNTSPSDPLTLLLVGMLLTCVACVACWLPARRAVKVDPMVALRQE
jgi:predicted permease